MKRESQTPPGRRARGTILHPTDYTGPSRRAFEVACRIARERGSRLIVLHVAEPVYVPPLGMAPVPPLPRGYRGAWESRLRLVRPRDPGVRVEHRLEEGDVAGAVLRVAREAHSDLIVMGGRERTGLGRVLTGSVAAQVGRQSSCPVVTVTVPPDRPAPATNRNPTVGGDFSWRDDMLDFRTILHPTDFSEPALYAFGLARALARDSDAELLVIHVAPGWGRRKSRRHRARYEALRRLTTADPSVRMHPLLLEGFVAPRVVCAAVELDCDLIVMGTNGRTGLRRLLLGSVAGAVRREAPCPVVAVQLPAREGWELPEFADEEALLGTRDSGPLGVGSLEANGRKVR